jgi:hypothetical protein
MTLCISHRQATLYQFGWQIVIKFVQRWGFVLLQVPQFCAAHRDNATMIHVAAICIENGCNRVASFGLKGSKVSVK